MKVEQSSSKPKRKIKKKKRKRRVRTPFIAIFLLLVISVTVALSMTVWFKISEIYCSGESIYTQEEIVSASGIYLDSNLIILPTAAIEEKIVTELPYIKRASIKRELPRTVNIEVVANEVAYAIFKQDAYLLVDNEFKVLEEVTERPDKIIISGVDLENSVPGSKMFVNDSDKKEIFEQITLFADSKGVSITAVNLENTVDLSFVIEDRIAVLLGNTENMENKVSLALAMLDSNNENYISEAESGTINLKYWSEANSQAIFRKGSIEEYLLKTDIEKNNE